MRRKRATDIPDGFRISPRVRKWADQHGFDRLDVHFEYFLLKVEANGYQYCNWDSALMTAIRDDWASLRKPKKTAHGVDIVKVGTDRGLPPRIGESMDEYQRRLMQARH